MAAVVFSVKAFFYKINSEFKHFHVLYMSPKINMLYITQTAFGILKIKSTFFPYFYLKCDTLKVTNLAKA